MIEKHTASTSFPDPAGLIPDRPLSLVDRRARRFATGLLASVAGPAVVTIALSPLDMADASRIAPLIYLIPVIAVASLGELGWGVLTSVLSVIALDYYFAEPLFRFEAAPQEIVELVVLLIVCFAIVRTLARQRRELGTADVGQRRLAFLAGANELLQRASLNFERTMTELARLSVPGLADWCTIDIRQDDGRLRTVAVAYGDRVRAALAENLAHQGQPNPDAPAGIAAVTRTGKPEMYPVVTAETIRYIARDPTHAALLRGLELRSLIIVPLLVRGEPIGAVKFASVRHDRRYAAEDLTLAEDLALRAGTALENVRLYQQRTREARVLQQSLLPATVPQVDGLEILPRFEAFGAGDLVGGDFYDVFEGRAGRWQFVVGDVCGKGAEAAAMTGLARHTVRALAAREDLPDVVLRALNEAILRAETSSYCTMAMASLRMHDGWAEVDLVRAGHPAPLLLRADGTVELAGEEGSLLGVLGEPKLNVSHVRLEPHDTLILYTDGLLDERRSDPESVLVAALRGATGLHAKEIADRIFEASAAQGAKADDRAVLVVKLDPLEAKGVTNRWK
jgi:serine phosphatase RsbU (regulator of sigma subunit)